MLIMNKIIGLESGPAVIIAVILLGVVIFTFIQLRKQVRHAKDKRNHQLRQRFEEGEISKSEYEEKKKDFR